MASRRITDKTIQAMLRKPGRNHVVDSLTGMVCRSTTRGTGAWSLVLRIDGRQERFTCDRGHYPTVGIVAARRWAQSILDDPKAALAAKAARKAPEVDYQPADSVGAVMQLWMRRDQEARGRRSRFKNEVILKRELAAWLDQPLSELTYSVVQEITDNISDRAPGVARRFKAHGHRMCQFALKRGIIATNPFGLVDVAEGQARSRVLTDDEIRKIWRAAELLGWPYGPIYRLLFLVPVRVTELGHAPWSDVDREHRVFRVPAERAKRGYAYDVPLSGMAMEIIDDLPRLDRSPLMFPSRAGTPLSNWSVAKERMDRLCEVQAWQARDIRRTARTLMSRVGIPRDIAERTLGHVIGNKVERAYDTHNYLPQMRRAVEKLAAAVDHILDATTPKVVALSRSAG